MYWWLATTVWDSTAATVCVCVCIRLQSQTDPGFDPASHLLTVTGQDAYCH